MILKHEHLTYRSLSGIKINPVMWASILHTCAFSGNVGSNCWRSWHVRGHRVNLKQRWPTIHHNPEGCKAALCHFCELQTVPPHIHISGINGAVYLPHSSAQQWVKTLKECFDQSDQARLLHHGMRNSSENDWIKPWRCDWNTNDLYIIVTLLTTRNHFISFRMRSNEQIQNNTSEKPQY